MEQEELKQAKEELYKEILVLQNDQKSFKRRVSTIANMLVPGIGFIVYGRSVMKALIVFLLFISYNHVYFHYLYPVAGGTGIVILFYLPAVFIWLISTFMVASLDD